MDSAVAFLLLPSAIILLIGVPTVAYLLGRFDNTRRSGRLR